MLTRLKIDGFKNLVGVDLHFGPFTCIVGPNGIGKSNVLDAIAFLSAMSREPFHEAALKVRSDSGRHGDIRHLFHRSGDSTIDTMRFEAEMLVPATGVDDLGQPATATITSLRYVLELRLRSGYQGGSDSPLELAHESLEPIKLGDVAENLHFEHSVKWRKSVASGRRSGKSTASGKTSGSEFISTKIDSDKRYIRLHQDNRQGRPRDLLASLLPRTVLSSTNAVESPTATLARKEMESWRILQLEPSLLREPDSFNSQPQISARGEHMAATLYRMAGGSLNGFVESSESDDESGNVYARIANRLAELYEDVQTLWVDRDEKRELLTVCVRTRNQETFPARALSDGTLRFLALSILEADDRAQGLVCLEEPENGIHPFRIPYMIQLLTDMAVDTQDSVSTFNPLRQVIINTHSPIVASNVPAQSLLVAVPRKVAESGKVRKFVDFQCVKDTWRHKGGLSAAVAQGELQTYLQAVHREEPAAQTSEVAARTVKALFGNPSQMRLWGPSGQS
ncbi:MAG: AAA family ATPase [Bryobacterales bacterium]|nr:AAA family ATPase [Bryobacterales bacterium]